MPDLTLKDDCLKLSWLNRLIKNTGAWKQPVLENLGMNEEMLHYYLMSNVKHEDLPEKIKSMCFWDKTFKEWCTVNFKGVDECITINGILSAHLWFNSNIKINKKTIFWKYWYTNGLQTIKDLIDFKTGRFHTWKSIQTLHNLPGNYLNLYSLISAIPTMWKRTIVENYPLKAKDIGKIDPTIFHRALVSKKPASILYKYLLNNRNDQPYERADRWSIDLDMFIEDLDLYKRLRGYKSHIANLYIKLFIHTDFVHV